MSLSPSQNTTQLSSPLYAASGPVIISSNNTTVLDGLMAPKLFESQMTTHIIDGLYQSLHYKLIPSKITKFNLTLMVN